MEKGQVTKLPENSGTFQKRYVDFKSEVIRCEASKRCDVLEVFSMK